MNKRLSFSVAISHLVFWCLFAFVLTFGLGASGVLGATNYTSTAGGSVDINEWSIWKRIVNSCSNNLFIPTNTSAEWTSYVNNSPACAPDYQMIGIAIARNSCNNGYTCDTATKPYPLAQGLTALVPATCNKGINGANGYPDGSRLLQSDGTFIKYCSYSGTYPNFTINCGVLPTNAGKLQYWGGPCI